MSEYIERTDEETAEESETIEDLDVPEGQQGDVAGGIKQGVAGDDIGDDRP